MPQISGNKISSSSIKDRVFSLPTLISLALAVAFLVFLVTRFEIDLGETWRQVKASNPAYLALAFLVHYTTFIFRGARWRLLLQNVQEQDRPTPGVLYCSQLLLLSWFVNSVGWFRVGDAYRAYLYQQEQGASFSRTIGTIFTERVLDTSMVVILLLIAVPLLVTTGNGVSWIVIQIALALLALLVVGLAVMLRGRRHIIRWLPDAAGERYQRFHEGAMGSYGRLPLVMLLGLMAWLAEIGRLFLVAHALGLGLSLPLVIFLTLASSLLTLVPTPGGLGAVESGVAGLAVRISRISTNGAAALVLVDRSISYASIIFVGAAVFLGRHLWRRSTGAKPETSISDRATPEAMHRP